MTCSGVLAIRCSGEVRAYRRPLDPPHRVLRLCEACRAVADRLGVPLVPIPEPEWVRRARAHQLPAKVLE